MAGEITDAYADPSGWLIMDGGRGRPTFHVRIADVSAWSFDSQYRSLVLWLRGDHRLNLTGTGAEKADAELSEVALLDPEEAS